MSMKSQDSSRKSQDDRNTGKTMEMLVPELELCRQIPEGAFEDSVMVITQDGCVEIRKGSMLKYRPEIKKYPAPTLEEIIEAIKTNTHSKDNLCDHKYTLNYCFIDLKWIFCFGENFAVADSLSSAALKLWLKLNSMKG